MIQPGAVLSPMVQNDPALIQSILSPIRLLDAVAEPVGQAMLNRTGSQISAGPAAYEQALAAERVARRKQNKRLANFLADFVRQIAADEASCRSSK